MWQQQNFHCTQTMEGGVRHIEYLSFAGSRAVSIDHYTLLAVPTILNFQTPIPNQTYLINSTRLQIFDYITQNPGIQFRAVASALCLPVGLAEYHLGILVRSGLVSFVRDGRYKRFFVSKQFSKREMLAICLLRRKTTRKILEVLLRRSKQSHCKLAGDVAITSQALTWQMKKLRSAKFVLQINDGPRTIYTLNENTKPMIEKYLTTVPNAQF
jgi:predicted transcriptional regulator